MRIACPVGSWIVPGGGKNIRHRSHRRAAKRSVVLLGEMHDNPEHHRWQLQTLAALHAVRPDMVIGFEMFPRRVQKALDQWVAGELYRIAVSRCLGLERRLEHGCETLLALVPFCAHESDTDGGAQYRYALEASQFPRRVSMAFQRMSAKA